MTSIWHYVSSEQEKIDQIICDLSGKYALSQATMPTNTMEEYAMYIKKNGEYNPQFLYKPYDIQAIEKIIHILKSIDIVGTDPISHLQRKKIIEQIEKYNLIIAYQKQDFENIYTYNTRLFETIPRHIDIPMPQHAPQISISEYLDTNTYDDMDTISMQQAYDIIKLKCNHMHIDNYIIVEKKLRSEYMSINCKNPIQINVNTKKTFNTKTFVALLRHELDGHIVRYRNGIQSGIRLLAEGTAYHRAVEEGVATYYQAGISGISARYENVVMMREKCKQAMHMDWMQLCYWIRNTKKTSLENAFWIALRVKQGIHDTSLIHIGAVNQIDRIYIEGWHIVDQYISRGLPIDNLLVGKIHIDDLQGYT